MTVIRDFDMHHESKTKNFHGAYHFLGSLIKES